MIGYPSPPLGPPHSPIYSSSHLNDVATKQMARHMLDGNPSIADDAMSGDSGRASPRNIVAAQLAGLNLTVGLPAVPSPMRDVACISPDRTPPKDLGDEMGSFSCGTREGSMHPTRHHSPPPPPLRERLNTLDGIRRKRTSPDSEPEPSEPRTPPSSEPSPKARKRKHVAFAEDGPLGAAATAVAPPSPIPGATSTLTWQDYEITGHLGLDPDDDGTGINGVGFRPTAKMEADRRRKRREQVERYRARVAREERERRQERRKSMKVGKARDVSPLKRRAVFRGASKFTL